MSEFDIAAKVEISPEELGRAFWHLKSDEQARFFAAVHEAAGSGYKLQMQGLYMRDDIREIPAAQEAIYDLFVWHFSLYEAMQEREARGAAA